MKWIDRRQLFLGASLLAAACAVARTEGLQKGQPIDLLLRGGSVIDGSGGPAFVADVAIVGDRIVGIGSYDASDASTTLDVRGLVVAPGFVDVHTHSDSSIFRHPGAESRVRQGVTTEITGNCGGSAAPRQEGDEEDAGSVTPRWTDVRSYAAAWASADPALNHALLVGHGTLRRAVLGAVDRRATTVELAAMTQLLETALDQGAIGLSTGLEYVPGIYTPAEEIEHLARSVAARGGLYASHMRSEEDRLLEAVDEAIEVGRKTGVRVQISHLKACGRDNWKLLDEAIVRIENARQAGVDVMADAYPYTAYSTTLTILLEPWSREGGSEAIVGRLQDQALRSRMRDELGPHVQSDPGGFELVVIAAVTAKDHEVCVGRSLAEIAAVWKVDAAEAYMRLLEASNADVSFIGHGMQKEGVARVLAHPLVMVGSDGRSMAPTGRVLERPHPRSYGTFPRVLGVYCRDEGLFDLPTAIRKMTAMPADRAGLAGRGRIAVLGFADVVVFDAATVRDEATYAEPQRYPTGIVHVVVNGELVVRDGSGTTARPGRWLSSKALAR
jgi:N-acyl-D-amino-acid deacylase